MENNLKRKHIEKHQGVSIFYNEEKNSFEPDFFNSLTYQGSRTQIINLQTFSLSLKEARELIDSNIVEENNLNLKLIHFWYAEGFSPHVNLVTVHKKVHYPDGKITILTTKEDEYEQCFSINTNINNKTDKEKENSFFVYTKETYDLLQFIFTEKMNFNAKCGELILDISKSLVAHKFN